MITGYTTGVFDLFHIGHLNLLRNAKTMCDHLIVGVTTDELVNYKHKKAVISFPERLEIVQNIKFVDTAIAQTSLDKWEAWQKLHYDILFVGDDWYKHQHWQDFEKKLAAEGVRIVYFPYTKTTSSTLINETLQYLRGEISTSTSDSVLS